MIESLLQAAYRALVDPEHHQGAWLMVAALSGSVSALVVVAAASVAYFQLREARSLRRAQTRPFVVIEFRPESSSLIYLRITNLGSTMARNVEFSFDRPLATTRGADWDVMKLQMFRTGIATLAPGRVIEFLFDTWIGREEANDRYVVKVAYSGDRRRRYVEALDLDLGLFRDTRFVHRAGLHELHEQVKSIASSLGDFKASGGGLLVRSEAELDRRRARWYAAAGDAPEASPPSKPDPSKPAHRRRRPKE